MIKISLKSKKLIFIVLLFTILFGTFLAFRLTRKLTLSVSVSPEGSLITVDEIYKQETKFEEKFNRGLHKVVVTKKGYQKEEREVLLDKDTSLTISLKPISEVQDLKPTTIREKPIYAPLFTGKNRLLAIDGASGNLIKIENGKVEILYKGNLKDYSFIGNKVVMIDSNNSSSLSILDLNLKTTTSISLPEFSPLVSVSYSNNQDLLYLLSNYEIGTKESVLSSIHVPTETVKNIGTFLASEVEFINDNYLLLFTSIDALDSSKVELFDLRTQKEVISIIGNSYSLSPDKTKVVIQASNKLTVLNITTLNTRSFISSFSEFATWKDQNEISILKSLKEGIELNIIDSSTFEKRGLGIVPNTESVQIREVYGISENILYLRDKKGAVQQIPLP